MERIKHHIHRHVGTHHVNTWEKFLLVMIIVGLGAFAIFYGANAYPVVFKTDVSMPKTKEIHPREPIVIDFSVPVLTGDYDSNIRVIPSEKFSLQWSNSNGRLIISPENFWKPGTAYEVVLPEGKNIMLATVGNRNFEFSTRNYPEVSSVFPENNAEDVDIDIEEPIVVKFTKPVSDFSLKFSLNSEESLPFQGDKSKTQYKILPKDGTRYSTEYHLKVYAKYAEDSQGNYKEIYQSSFKTAPPPEIVWDSDYSIRLEQAKKYTQAKMASGRYIDINLSSQVMTIFEDGKLLDSFMISSGKRGMDTPKGKTQIYNKFPRAYSRKYGLYMPYWMAITPSGQYGLHELPEWPSGYKEGASHLGIPVSHGCVRMGVGAAERVYNFAEVGTPVVIY